MGLGLATKVGCWASFSVLRFPGCHQHAAELSWTSKPLIQAILQS